MRPTEVASTEPSVDRITLGRVLRPYIECAACHEGTTQPAPSPAGTSLHDDPAATDPHLAAHVPSAADLIRMITRMFDIYMLDPRQVALCLDIAHAVDNQPGTKQGAVDLPNVVSQP